MSLKNCNLHLLQITLKDGKQTPIPSPLSQSPAYSCPPPNKNVSCFGLGVLETIETQGRSVTYLFASLYTTTKPRSCLWVRPPESIKSQKYIRRSHGKLPREGATIVLGLVFHNAPTSSYLSFQKVSKENVTQDVGCFILQPPSQRWHRTLTHASHLFISW